MFKPMLSGKVLSDLSNVRFPVFASLKLDGIRCIIQNGIAVSRTLKPIPNQYVQQCLKGLPDGLDGELIVGNPNHPDVFNITQSGVMSESGMPDFKYYVFDYKSDDNFERRNILARLATENYSSPHFCWLDHWLLYNESVLLQFEEYAVTNGYEGIMLRDPNGPYKEGRSTDKQGWLLKMKRFHDTEATVIGFEELKINNNEQEISELGYAKRSKQLHGLVNGDTLGSLICRLDNGIEFNCGSGFTDFVRDMIWNNKQNYIGKKIKFKYQNWTTEKKPRMPIFLSFRMD